MNKLFLLTLLFFVFFVSETLALSCSPTTNNINIACTHNRGLHPRPCHDCGVVFSENYADGLITATIPNSEDSLNVYIKEDFIQIPSEQVVTKENGLESLKKILRFMNDSCDEDLIFVADNFEELSDNWEPVLYFSSSSIINSLTISGKNSEKNPDFEEYNEALLKCDTYEYKEVGNFVSYYLIIKDYCFLSGGHCGSSSQINYFKLFSQNMINPSLKGLLYNTALIAILGALIFSFIVLIKNKFSRNFMKPNWINVILVLIFALLILILSTLLSTVSTNIFSGIIFGLIIIIFNYVLGSIINLGREKSGLRKTLGINKISGSIMILGFLLIIISFFLKFRYNIFINLIIFVCLIYWYFVISTIIVTFKNKKYKQE